MPACRAAVAAERIGRSIRLLAAFQQTATLARPSALPNSRFSITLWWAHGGMIPGRSSLAVERQLHSEAFSFIGWLIPHARSSHFQHNHTSAPNRHPIPAATFAQTAKMAPFLAATDSPRWPPPTWACAASISSSALARSPLHRCNEFDGILLHLPINTERRGVRTITKPVPCMRFVQYGRPT